jgi:hypothetical protein
VCWGDLLYAELGKNKMNKVREGLKHCDRLCKVVEEAKGWQRLLGSGVQ